MLLFDELGYPELIMYIYFDFRQILGYNVIVK